MYFTYPQTIANGSGGSQVTELPGAHVKTLSLLNVRTGLGFCELTDEHAGVGRKQAAWTVLP